MKHSNRKQAALQSASPTKCCFPGSAVRRCWWTPQLSEEPRRQFWGETVAWWGDEEDAAIASIRMANTAPPVDKCMRPQQRGNTNVTDLCRPQ